MEERFVTRRDTTLGLIILGAGLVGCGGSGSSGGGQPVVIAPQTPSATSSATTTSSATAAADHKHDRATATGTVCDVGLDIRILPERKWHRYPGQDSAGYG